MHLIHQLTLGFGIPGSWEWIIVLIIGLLLFGRKLPDVGRWLGQGIVEFKKGIKGIEDDIEDASNDRPRKDPRGEPRDEQSPAQLDDWPRSQEPTAEKRDHESVARPEERSHP